MARAATGSRTATLVERAERLFPGGVNSPVRAFRAVGRPPLLLERGEARTSGMPMGGGMWTTWARGVPPSWDTPIGA